MATLAKRGAAHTQANAKSVINISDIYIRQDSEGRYSLNDLHKAAGNEPRHAPAQWMRLEQVTELIRAIFNMQICTVKPVDSYKGRYGGTYVCKELVYAYATWISAEFFLKVIRAYDALVSGDIKKAESITKTTVDERTPLRDAVNLLVSKKHLMYPEAYAIVHQRFNVKSIEDLSPEQVTNAIEYVHHIAIEGEFLGKQEELAAPRPDIPDITMEWWYNNNFPMRTGNLERYPGHQAWNDLTLTPPMMYGKGAESPSLYLIEILERMGFDMVAPRIEVETMRIMLGKGKQKIRVVGDGRVKHLLSL